METLAANRPLMTIPEAAATPVGRSSVDAPVERDGTSSKSEAVEPAQLTGDEAA
jgi:hypothetical protein